MVKLKRYLKIFITTTVLTLFANSVYADSKSCLLESQLSEYKIYEREIKYFSDDDFKKKFGAASKNNSNDRNLVKAGVSDSIIVDGLAQFIEDRTKLELQLWLVQSINRKICVEGEANTAPYFKNTCELKLQDSVEPLSIEYSFDLFVEALRKDFKSLPACLVNEQAGSKIGYLLSSLYDEYSKAQDLEKLVYDLALNDHIYNGNVCSSTNSNACPFAVSIIGYATMLEMKEIYKKKDVFQVVEVYLSKFKERLQKCEENAKCKNSFFEKVVKDIDGGLANNNNLKAKVARKIERFYQIRNVIANKVKKIKADLKGKQELLEAKNREILEHFKEQLLLLSKFNGTFDDSVQKYQAFIDKVQTAYSQYTSNDYVKSLYSLKQALAKIDKKLPDSLEKIGFTVSSLAASKDKDEFASKLDSLASPVGAWKLKHVDDMLTVNAFGGFRYGKDTFTVDELNLSFEDSSTNVFAPVGIHKTWAEDSFNWGLFVSILDMGNIINAPDDLSEGAGTILGDVDSSLDNVFSPGVFITASPFKDTPVTFGLGVTYGPSSGYRKYRDDAGNEFDVGREESIQFFIAVDIVLFPIR